MWVKKSQQEIRKANFKKYGQTFWAFFIVFLMLGLFTAKTGLPGYYGYGQPHDWKEIPNFFPWIILISGFVSLSIVYLETIGLSSRFQGTTIELICPQCGNIKCSDGKPVCPCGGSYSLLSQYEWVADEESSSQMNN